MTNALGAQFLRVRWETQVGIDLGLAEQLFRLRSRALNKVHVLPWIQANIAQNRAEENMGARPESGHGDGPSLEVADRLDPFRPE